MGKIRNLTCKQCKEPFRAHPSRRYCSIACKYIFKYPPRDKRVIKFGRTCYECGAKYDGPRNKFCSDACFGAACHRRREGDKRQLVVINREIVIRNKSVPCMDCGRQYPHYIMDFDHVRGEKYKNVSEMMYLPTFLVEAEIEKCEVVCSNCHRARTYLRAHEWVQLELVG